MKFVIKFKDFEIVFDDAKKAREYLKKIDDYIFNLFEVAFDLRKKDFFICCYDDKKGALIMEVEKNV